MKGFRDAITEAGKAYPHLEVYWEEIHDRWNEHLGDLGLDPELFRYQREMNADEGEAAGLFAVKKDSDFTDLLLRAVTDTRDTDGLADLVSGFGNKLGRRAELTAERDFTAGSVDLLGRIVEAAETARTRRATSTRAPNAAPARLARRLSARGAEERGRAADLAQQVTAAAHAVTDAERARERSAADRRRTRLPARLAGAGRRREGAPPPSAASSPTPARCTPPGRPPRPCCATAPPPTARARVAAAIRRPSGTRPPRSPPAPRPPPTSYAPCTRPPRTASGSPTRRRSAPPPSRRSASPPTATPPPPPPRPSAPAARPATCASG